MDWTIIRFVYIKPYNRDEQKSRTNESEEMIYGYFHFAQYLPITLLLRVMTRINSSTVPKLALADYFNRK